MKSEALWRKGGTHAAEKVGKTEVHVLNIELKRLAEVGVHSGPYFFAITAVWADDGSGCCSAELKPACCSISLNSAKV
jgi:hypothetical protein